jgi:hypothetical protein
MAKLMSLSIESFSPNHLKMIFCKFICRIAAT